MTNEEAINTLQIFSQIRGGSENEAMKIAIKALENQERMQRELKSMDRIAETCDKLENALELAVRDSDKYGTDIWCHDCPYGDDERLNHCWECGVKHYKRQAGIEVAENDE